MASETPRPEQLRPDESSTRNQTPPAKQGPPLGTLALVGGGILLLVILGVLGNRSGDSTSNTSVQNRTAQSAQNIEALVPEAEARRALPSDAELRKLVKNTLLDWNVCVQKRDFSSFLASNAAQDFREGYTPDKLKQQFAPFIQQNIDISAIKTVTPTLQPVQIDDNGVVAISGVYPTQPSRVSFRLRYVLENKAWKVVGVSVTLV